ncbi:MAG: RHS repeat-associated core domain-containing protein [Clostridia bacterium]|nr:RHS repeat-associated core domain-containing protein [Clostridia bacterium]
MGRFCVLRVGAAISRPQTLRKSNGRIISAPTLYSYDQYSRASGVEIASMAGSPSQSYNYDTLGRTSSVVNQYSENGAVTQSYTYVTHNGNQTGLVETISYTKNGESVLPTLHYEYDAKGNITSIYENEVLKAEYEYDALNRLITEFDYSVNIYASYVYNGYGNMLCKSDALDTVEFEYDSPSSGNAVSKYGDYTMTYDEIGNPISYKGYSMAWTKAKQLASVSGNGITMSFKYDSNGIRTLKRVNGVDTEFTYAGTTLVSQKTGNEIINFAYTAGGAPYGFTYNGTNYFYLLNLQGDIIGIYDSNGDVVVKYAYDSWGQLMSITGTLADTIGVKNPLRYRGYYYDTETKLYYLQSRYYDPETCHFISMDSYFVAGDYINGMNMYAYCLNNPVMYVDPSGCMSEFAFEVMKIVSFVMNTAGPIITFMSPFITMSTELEMSTYEILLLTIQVGNYSDLSYVVDVMYKGKSASTLSEEEQDKYKNIGMCKAYSNKNVCLEIAKWYTWVDGGTTQEAVAQEIYAHALVHYYSEDVLNYIGILKKYDPYQYYSVPQYALMEAAITSIDSHAGSIDLGGDGIFDKAGVALFPFVWNYF